ncbi:MAG: SDR family oxidoreductase [Phycisphaerae bacterium]
MSAEVVVVTGGGRGIGRAICRRFAADGARIVAAARSGDELAETQRLVQQDGGTCRTIKTNVASSADVEKMIGMAVREFSRVDVLVNNAGVACNNSIEEFDLQVFDAMMAVNVGGVFYACRAVWPVMREHGGGVIVNISSVAAVDPFPGFAAYGASKACVEALTRGLAAEGQACGIRVYGVGPGAVDTQMLRGPFPDFPPEQCLKPADVAEAVWMMTQPSCQYSVGQTLYVKKS